MPVRHRGEVAKSTNTRTQQKKGVRGQRLDQVALPPKKRPGAHSRASPESPVPTGIRTREQPARSESPYWPVRYYKMTNINNNRLTLLMSVICACMNATSGNNKNYS